MTTGLLTFAYNDDSCIQFRILKLWASVTCYTAKETTNTKRSSATTWNSSFIVVYIYGVAGKLERH